MKNIITFINPKKKFDAESKALVKIQIDNSLSLGWSLEDIWLITNFDYQYGRLKALVFGDNLYCDYSPISTKIPVIVDLFERGLIGDELYWAHDIDAFQLVDIPEAEIELGTADMGLCDYGRMPKFAGGSIFFKKSARDIFERIKETMDEHQAVDENAVTYLTANDEHIRDRIKKMNISYNFLSYNVQSCYAMAIKPIRVAHFHPLKKQRQMGIKKPIDFYKGSNKIGVQLIPDRLIKIFDYHGVR